jgi:hypothetical protein
MLGASSRTIEEIMDPRARPSECQTKRFTRSSLQHHPDNPAVLQIDGSTASRPLKNPGGIGAVDMIHSTTGLLVEGNDAGIGQAVEGAFLVCRS